MNTILWLWGCQASAGPDIFAFSKGQAALDLPALSAQDCGDCHAAQYQGYLHSQHQQAWSNPIFQEGFLREPRQACIFCHAPLKVQAQEITTNHAWYAAQRHPNPQNASIIKAPETQAEQGISCVVCHFREGAILTPHPVQDAPHPTRYTPELQQSEFCMGCHDFPFITVVNGQEGFSAEPMQRTGAEWRQWGGQQSCQDCHMPTGDHQFRGAHDQAWLRASVQIRATETGFWLQSVGVGHHLPSGDLFRHITLSVDGQVIARLGRRFVVQEVLGVPEKREIEDTSLLPGEQRWVPWPKANTSDWTLRYHYASEADERRGNLSADQLWVDLDRAAMP